MSEKIINNTEVIKDISCHSGKTHWTWHLLFGISGMLILTALIFNDAFMERWFSSDHHITDDGKKYLNLLRYGLLVMAGGCIVLWTLRKKITSYFRVAVERWKESPSDLDASSIVPPLHPAGLQQVLLLILSLWTVFVVITLVPGYDTWAAHLTHENGVTETLTVIFYFFAGVMAIILAVPSLRRNSRKGLFYLWLLGLAEGCLFVALEETNWGEIYFHYEAGELIRASNYQNEVSLHNISLPFIGSYWANGLLQIMAICGGVLLPLMIRFSRSFRRILWSAEFPTPPWLSQACFFVAALIPQDQVIQLQRANIPSELREVTIAFGVAIWLWATSRNRCYQYSKHIN
ncbi:MAG: hypothetical protein HZB30_12495 [Nitrospirae bacterium]|nr:hypothetical protein [Nitrospirota bacterium]